MREEIKIYTDECTGDDLVAVPHKIATALKLNEGDAVECRLAEGRMIVTKITEKGREFDYIDLGDAIEDIMAGREPNVRGISISLTAALISVVIMRLQPMRRDDRYYEIADKFVAMMNKSFQPEMVLYGLRKAAIDNLDFNTTRMPAYKAAVLRLVGVLG